MSKKVELEKELRHIHMQLAGKHINLNDFENTFEDKCKGELTSATTTET